MKDNKLVVFLLAAVGLLVIVLSVRTLWQSLG